MNGRARRVMPALAAVSCALALAACAQAPVARVRTLAPSSGRVALAFASVRAAENASAAVSGSAASLPLAHADLTALLGKPLRRAPFKTRRVALTLDDGPAYNLNRVLDIFEAAGARCTFFFVGNRSPRHHVAVRRAADEGFEIENHTFDHQEVMGVGEKETLRQIDLAQRELRLETGRAPRFFRPPAGHWDEPSLKATTERGLVMALWSLHGHDTGPGTHAEIIARNVIASAQGGDIVLLHETNPETVKALPAILAGLRRKGLEPVTLEELLTAPSAKGVRPRH